VLSGLRSLVADRVVGRPAKLAVGLVVGAVGRKYLLIMRFELCVIDRLWSASAVKAGHILKC